MKMIVYPCMKKPMPEWKNAMVENTRSCALR